MAATADVDVKLVTADRERKAKKLAEWHKEAFAFRKKLNQEKKVAAREAAAKMAGVSEVSWKIQVSGTLFQHVALEVARVKFQHDPIT